MPDPQSILELNRELARQINEEARRNPQSPYLGKFVGIANGRVVVVAENLDDLVRDLLRIEPNPQKTFGIEVGLDYDEPQYIWDFC